MGSRGHGNDDSDGAGSWGLGGAGMVVGRWPGAEGEAGVMGSGRGQGSRGWVPVDTGTTIGMGQAPGDWAGRGSSDGAGSRPSSVEGGRGFWGAGERDGTRGWVPVAYGNGDGDGAGSWVLERAPSTPSTSPGQSSSGEAQGSQALRQAQDRDQSSLPVSRDGSRDPALSRYSRGGCVSRGAGGHGGPPLSGRRGRGGLVSLRAVLRTGSGCAPTALLGRGGLGPGPPPDTLDSPLPPEWERSCS